MEGRTSSASSKNVELQLLDGLGTDFSYLRRFILAAHQMARMLRSELARSDVDVQEKVSTFPYQCTKHLPSTRHHLDHFISEITNESLMVICFSLLIADKHDRGEWYSYLILTRSILRRLSRGVNRSRGIH